MEMVSNDAEPSGTKRINFIVLSIFHNPKISVEFVLFKFKT